MEIVSSCGIDKTFMSIGGIYIFSILCIDNTYTYDVDKQKKYNSQR